MSTIDQKKQALLKSKEYHDENTQFIRIDANVPKTVVFPANWSDLITYKEKEFPDENDPEKKRTATYTCYKVHNPNSANPKVLRDLDASASLDAQIGEFLNMSLEQGVEGAILAKIVKKQKGNSRNVTWSVQGDKLNDDQLKELRIIE